MSIDEAKELLKLLIEKAKNMPPNDPGFKDLTNAINNMIRWINDYHRLENERNHNNIQDDLSEEELKVNAKKVKVDFIRSILDFGGKVLFLVGSLAMGAIAYVNEAEKFNLPSSKGLLDAAKNLLSSFKK